MRRSQLGCTVSSAAAIAVLAFGILVVPAPQGAMAQDAGLAPAKQVKPEVAELGKRLFYDDRLSGDTSMSCASCHQPEKAFTDGEALSAAYTGAGHFRNTPTLANVGHRAAWFHDGRQGTNLNDVTREMITETYLMNMDMRIMQERMKQDPVYVEMFKAAGKGEPSNGGARSAIAWISWQPSPRAALRLIPDTLSCFRPAWQGPVRGQGRVCRPVTTGDRYTDDQPHNIGVPDNPDIWADPDAAFGVHHLCQIHGRTELHEPAPRPWGLHSQPPPRDRTLVPDADFARADLDRALHAQRHLCDARGCRRFLRCRAVAMIRLKDSRLKPLGLIPSEKSDLIAFLQSLSGDKLRHRRLCLAGGRLRLRANRKLARHTKLREATMTIRKTAFAAVASSPFWRPPHSPRSPRPEGHARPLAHHRSLPTTR
jgi:cytochrome c peroxidase